MLIPKRNKKEKTFYIECANWSAVINAADPEEAATKAFEETLEKHAHLTEVSPVFTVLDLNGSIRDMEIPDNVHFVYAPAVLANAGMHDTSQKLQFIIDNLKKRLT
jgi:hypothetical protein